MSDDAVVSLVFCSVPNIERYICIRHAIRTSTQVCDFFFFFLFLKEYFALCSQLPENKEFNWSVKSFEVCVRILVY